MSVAQEGPACWSLTASADEAAGQPPAAPEARPAASAAKNGPRTLALITTPTLGRGDDGLGAKLMTNFLTTLPELGSHLWRVILINGGVTLAATPARPWRLCSVWPPTAFPCWSAAPASPTTACWKPRP